MRHTEHRYKQRLCLDLQFHFAARGGTPYDPQTIRDFSDGEK